MRIECQTEEGFIGDVMEDSQTLKPLSCTIGGTEARTTFDVEELRRYLNRTTDTGLWVVDSNGNRAPIRVGFLREALV